MAAVNKQKKVELAPLPNALLAGGAKLELPVKYQSHSVEKLFKLAERFFRNGKFEKAQDLYAEIIGRKGEKETDSLLVHSLIGLCKTQLQLGITERAFENLQKAEFKSSQLKESSLLEAEIILITITAHIKLGLYPDERIKSRLPFSFMAKENEFDFSKHALHFLRKAKEIFTNSGNCTEERKEQIIKLELQTHVLTSSDKISELALKIFYDKSL
ncbi:MAG: hypothetical protein KDD56_10265, partial [Bdellovibrionales bacterium]|nr:hypothetical protein [Bdellovibrionales bacterium]